MRRRHVLYASLLVFALGAGEPRPGAARGRSSRARAVDGASDEVGPTSSDRAASRADARIGREDEAARFQGKGSKAEPRSWEPRSGEPRTREPRSGEPRTREPRTREPRARAPRLRPEEIQRLLGRFAHEPSVETAQNAAVRLVLAEAGRPAGWLRRSSKAAWLPSVQLGAGVQQRRDRRLDREVGSPSLIRADAANQFAYEIKLSWDLSRLIFEPNALRVIHEAQRIAELREQVVMQVTRLYFERRRLQLDSVARPVISASAALGREMRLAELTAVLNALTGGLFRPGSEQSRGRAP